MDLFDKFSDLSVLIDSLEQSGNNPFGVRIDSVRSATEAVINGRDTVLAGTNNYLGLTLHPECIEAAREALTAQGSGTTGSRVANGTYGGHRQLEEALAEFFGCQLAIIFTTGYQANLGVISGLAGAGDTILIDADSHASIYDGCKMSAATTIRFRHNDPDDLDKRLSRLEPSDSNKLVVIEGIYSMIGDRAPLKELVEVKKRHNAYLLVDEAHSLGVLGETGRGLAEEAGCSDDVDFFVGTFSKSLGAIGGFCASNHPLTKMLRFSSTPYMFSASLSPSNVASVLAALPLLRDGKELRANLWQRARQLYDGLSALNFGIGADHSPVLAIEMPSQDQAVAFWNRVLENGVYVNLAIPPGTPSGQSLLRCSVSAAHTADQIDQIIGAFGQAAQDLG